MLENSHSSSRQNYYILFLSCLPAYFNLYLAKLRSSKDNWTQTSELLTYDKEVQSVVKEDIKTQTEEEATAENRTASIAEDKSDVSELKSTNPCRSDNQFHFNRIFWNF
jgi:hypothetical protein